MFVWILLGVLYVACWVYFGLATFRIGIIRCSGSGSSFRSCGSSERSSHPPNAPRHGPQGRPGDINPQRAVLPALEVVAGATELLSIQSEPLGAG